jgi:protease YdgD
LLAAAFLMAPAAALGADGRKLVTQSDWPWQAIGRVNIVEGGYCTGTLVAPQMVLTAAHCLWDRRARRSVELTRLHFVAGYQRGDFLAHARVVGVVSPGLPPPDDGGSAKFPGNDWALLQLDRDLSATVAPLPVIALDAAALSALKTKNAVFLQAGYRSDRAHALLVNHDCKLIRIDENRRILLHKCDVASGDSGSPILARTNEGYAVIAVYTAKTRRQWQGFGIAVPGAAFKPMINRLTAEAPA